MNNIQWNHSELIALGQSIVHAADLSNPTRQWNESYIWARRVLEEFLYQSNIEKIMKKGLECVGGSAGSVESAGSAGSAGSDARLDSDDNHANQRVLQQQQQQQQRGEDTQSDTQTKTQTDRPTHHNNHNNQHEKQELRNDIHTLESIESNNNIANGHDIDILANNANLSVYLNTNISISNEKKLIKEDVSELATLNLGFGINIVKPLYQSIIQIVPLANQCLENMTINQKNWENIKNGGNGSSSGSGGGSNSNSNNIPILFPIEDVVVVGSDGSVGGVSGDVEDM